MISYKQYRLLNEMTFNLGLGNPQAFLQTNAQLEEAKKKKMFGGEPAPEAELGDEAGLEDEEGHDELDGEEEVAADDDAAAAEGDSEEGDLPPADEKMPPKFSKKKMTKEEYEWLEKLNSQLTYGLKEAKKKMFGDEEASDDDVDDDDDEADAETGDGEIVSKKDAPPKDKAAPCVEKKSCKKEATDDEKEFIAALTAQMTHGLKSNQEYGKDYSKFVEDALLAPESGEQASEPKPGEVGYAPTGRLGGPVPTFAEWLNER